MWKRLCVLVVSVSLCVIPALPLEGEDVQDPGQYLNSFLVEVEKREIAEQVAKENGFVVVEGLPQLDHLYHLSHPEVTGRSKRSAHDYIEQLKSDHRVKFVEQQISLKRTKRDHGVIYDKQTEFPIREIKDNTKYFRVADRLDTRNGLPRFTDEFYNDQWYLHNVGQTGGKEHIDLNVERAWDMGITGKGVVISILDDGIDHGHPDLVRSYDPDASLDLNDRNDVENDPMPDKSSSANSHGTRCAGEIAAEANNGICGVGIAYDAKVGGIRILDGKVTDILEATALLFNNQHVDIYSASWGPHDDGRTMEQPHKACSDALRKGVQTGRGGKGSIYVWACGNGGEFGDSCAADGYVSSIESISVQSLSDSGLKPFYGESCTSTMISVPSGGEKTRDIEMESHYKIKVVTTDLNGGCIENFEGTSSAAPLAAGCLALVLQANPELSWRDVQHLVVREARVPQNDDDLWIKNGAGLHVNDKFGFGMMDCARMVEAAQQYTDYKPEQHVCETDIHHVNEEIPSSGCYKQDFHFDGCQHDQNKVITNLEHVQLHVKLSTGRRGNIEIFLTSPLGTRSKILPRRKYDASPDGIDFLFMTVHSWEESPVGTWNLKVCHNPGSDDESSESLPENEGTLESWSLQAYGYRSHKRNRVMKKAHHLTKDDLTDISEREYNASIKVNIKRAEEPAFGPAEQKQEIDEYAKNADDFLSKFKNLFDERNLDDMYSSDDKISRVNGNGNAKHEARGYGEKDADRQINKADDGNEIEALTRQIVDILEELDDNGSTTLSNYLEEYLERRKEEKHKREMEELIYELREVLSKK